MKFEIVGSLFALVGLASPLALLAFLDKYLRKDMKTAFALSLFGNSGQSVADRVSLFHATLLSRALGKGFFKRFLRIWGIGVVSIIFVYSLQYFFHRESFEEYSLPFLRSLFSFNPFSIFVMLSFVTVDAISFFQTVTFARLAAYCTNPIEVTFLAFADVIVSLFLVIIILPVLIIGSHKISTDSRPATFKLALDNGAQSQQMSLRDALLMAAPLVKQTKEADVDEGMKSLRTANENGWTYSIPDMYVTSADEPISLDRVASGKLASAGLTFLMEKGDLNVDDTANAIVEILRTEPSFSDVELIESYREPFGRSIYTINLKGRSTPSKLSFARDYSYLMSEVNFFNNDFSKLLSLGSKVFSENELMWIGQVNGASENMQGRIVVKCDDRKPETVERDAFVADAASKCTNGVAFAASSLSGIAGLLSYKFSSITQIPILPTALSSIFLTVLIYLCIILWISLPYVKMLVVQYSADGATVFEENVFTITFLSFYVVALPVVYLIWTFG